MAIEKLQLTVAAREKAKAADFNRVTSKIDEIIDSIADTTFYGKSTSAAQDQCKMADIDTFVCKANTPLHGCVLMLNIVNGNTADNMSISINGCYSKPVYYGSEPVANDVIKSNTMLTMVYDANDSRWNITAGLSTPLPALYIKEFSLYSIVKGRYTSQEVLSRMFGALIGDVTKPVYEKNQILMLWNKTYVPVCLMEEEIAYTYEFVYGSKHYAFRLYKKPDGTYTLEVTDAGSKIITQWEE